MKSNADNSQELSYYQGFEQENYLRQIEWDHQIFFLQLATKSIEQAHECELNQKCTQKAINLDLCIKSINEELTNHSER